MEFNRLLSRAISFYGELGKNNIELSVVKEKLTKVNTKDYESIVDEKKDLMPLLKAQKKFKFIYRQTENN